MATLKSALTWIVANYKKTLIALVALLTAVAGILKVIPGQPGESQVETAIQVLEKIDGQ
jgi:hypothetical protein